jgi:signal transduction histidine kinase
VKQCKLETASCYLDFERFYRVASKHRHSPAGLGIGLSIASQIIEHYGGKLWVESVEGEGSTFFFSLPRPMMPLL